MSMLAWAILGALGASSLWMFVVAWLLDRIAAQRAALGAAQTTLRLYRETRDHADAQVRELLEQNTRLARQLLDQAAAQGVRPAVTTWPVVARES